MSQPKFLLKLCVKITDLIIQLYQQTDSQTHAQTHISYVEFILSTQIKCDRTVQHFTKVSYIELKNYNANNVLISFVSLRYNSNNHILWHLSAVHKNAWTFKFIYAVSKQSVGNFSNFDVTSWGVTLVKCNKVTLQ